MKQIFLMGLLLLLPATTKIVAQTQNVDSLVKVLETGKLSNKEQMDICKQLCFEYQNNNIEKLMTYAERGLLLAKNENDKAIASDFYRYIGVGYDLYGKLDSAMVYYKKGLEWALETKNKECEMLTYKDMAYIHIT